MTNLDIVQHAFGCDIDLKHGAIVYISGYYPTDDSPFTIANFELVESYEKGISERSRMDQVLDQAYMLNLAIEGWWSEMPKNVIFPRWPDVCVEYDINRVHYKGARKKSMVQLAHMIGAFCGELYTHSNQRYNLYKPFEKRRILKGKAHDWDSFEKLTGCVFSEYAASNLPPIDPEFDIPDATAVAIYHMKKRLGEFPEENE